MAKGDAAFKKWAEEFKKKLPDNLQNSWTALVDNDYEGKEDLVGGFLMQQDYTSKTQALAKAREEAEAEKAALQAEYDRKVAAYQSWYEDANAIYVEQQERLTEMQGRNGDGNGQGAPSKSPSDELRQQLQALQSRLDDVDRGTYHTVVGMSKIAHQAAKEGYSFDPEKIVAISTKNRLPLEKAFEEFIGPEKAEREKKALEKQLEDAREAGRREALSNRTSPDAMGSNLAANPVLETLFKSGQPAQKSNYDLVQAAVKGFYEAGEGS